MVSHLVSGWGSRIQNYVWDVFEQKTSRTITKKTDRVGATRIHKAFSGSTPYHATQPLSPLRLLFWTSLFVGSRGQLTDPFPANFELSSLDGKNGFVINGTATGDSSSYSVSTAGDFNGDGIDDIVIGAPNVDILGNENKGRSYVVYGSFTAFSSGVFDLSSLNGINGFIINGDQVGGGGGFSVSSAGDVNGDQLSDLIIGARKADLPSKPLAGQSYLIFGTRARIIGGVLNLSNLNGMNGFYINGEASRDESGRAVKTAGDVNGDGLSDILIGAFLASPLRRIDAGKSYVVFGSRTPISGGVLELSSLNGVNGFILNGETADDNSGRSVSTAGDVNGDGVDDLIVGAYGATVSGIPGVGKSYLLYGNRQSVRRGSIDLSSLKDVNSIILNGEAEDDECGGSVSSAGDVNGDGLADIVIGAANASPFGRSQAGKSYVVFGNKTTNKGGVFDLSNLNGFNGFAIYGERTGDQSGISVSSAGDINGDGLSDIVIGANRATPSNRNQAGKSYIIFGSSTHIRGGVLELSSLDGKNGFIMTGESTRDRSGGSVSSAGDVNGDGISDVVIGDQGSTTFQVTFVGKCYVIFGRKLSQRTKLLPSTAVIEPSQQKKFSSTALKPISEQTVATTVLSPSLLEVTSPTTNLYMTDEARVSTFSNESPSTESSPLVVVIATAVTALACSFIGGVLFYFKNCSHRSTAEHGATLNNLQTDPSVKEYDKFPPPARIYDQVVIPEDENDNNNYDIVNVSTRNPEHNYESPLSPL